ncbi:MAG: hypothetical protein O9286_07865 [Aquidulcibacter sp.]|jgi:hypothetical protein|uniref:hypothetical protein n=1 Tax=Aquidulcibacter sp. TaxID=2052990 RepID=UPI0022BB7BA6|nr:hypothetical protein [Aquidulcibacter sp.]
MKEAVPVAPDWGGRYQLPGGVYADWRHDPKAQLAYGAFPTRLEVTLVWVAALALFAWTATAGASHSWSWWQWAIAAFLAMDIGGGAVANCLNSAKRFYHAPPALTDDTLSKLARRPLVFAAIHIHPVIAALAFSPAMLAASIGWFVALFIGSALVRAVPLFLARPVAALVVTGAIVVSSRTGFIVGLEWLPGVLFLKIVLGHMVREEPYGS